MITNHDDQYNNLLSQIQANLKTALADPKEKLFIVHAPGVFDLFLAKLPDDEERRIHRCNDCRRFMEKFGCLVTINASGVVMPVMWDKLDVPTIYKASITAIYNLIATSVVVGVFYDKERTWGLVANESKTTKQIWRHMAANPPVSHIWSSRTQSPEQAMAERDQDYIMLDNALKEFTTPQLEIARMITSEDNDLYRSEKVRGVAEWLFKLKQRTEAASSKKRRAAILWNAVANAPAGWCHVKSSMIGTLLDDIGKQLPYAEIERNFRFKMNPRNYGHSTQAPAAGTIKTAEALFEKLELAPSLVRRYARLRDIPTHGIVWSSKGTKTIKTVPGTIANHPSLPPGGVFGGVKARGQVVDARTSGNSMSWERFQRTILPNAKTVEVLIPNSADHFMALVTADHKDSHPILQWDSDLVRNQLSWYYAAGIDAEMHRRVTEAGGMVTGVDVRCTLMWNNYNDLDLHCLTPAGEHIFYAAKEACRYGGNLDVDRNVHGETNKPVENIRWAKGRAPRGHYQFWVNLYATHGGCAAPTPFSVEVEANGQVFSFKGTSKYNNSNNYYSNMVKVADFMYEPGVPIKIAGSSVPDVRSAAISPNLWNMTPGTYVPVTAVVRSPNMWGARPQPMHGEHAFFLLKGCVDTKSGVGKGFMAETVQSELRPVRSVLEAYNNSAAILGTNMADACGIGISNSVTGNLTVRVNGQSVYTLDRWE